MVMVNVMVVVRIVGVRVVRRGGLAFSFDGFGLGGRRSLLLLLLLVSLLLSLLLLLLLLLL